ncbi:MAG TPA: hypothetical protein VFH26_08750 [Gemmatimonadales bacterium]|nr:hypothetical protein [Gemmatimonadales bacterium]
MAAAPKRSLWVRLSLSFAAGLASALVVAILIAVVDLYLAGHGMAPLNAPLLNWAAAGVHLSLADLIFLSAAALAAAIAWRRTARPGT